MWQELIQQVGIIWVILVLLSTAGLIALAVIFFVTMHGMATLAKNKLNRLGQEVDALTSCRIENLPIVQTLVDEQMNKEFKLQFDRLVEDSNLMFGSIWVPDPASRLPLQETLPEPTRISFHKSTGSAVILGGIAVSAMALSSGFVLNGSLADAAFLRFIALMPFVASALCMLVLYQGSDAYFRQVRHAWQRLMIALERRLPVYSQAAETAIILNQMKDYDARMSQSTQILAEQVQHLVSNKLTDAISNSVKYVMSATVAPAVIKSTEALALLAQQLDKQLQKSDHAIVKLYTDLETRQHKQSELWLKRYQEISEVLTDQQAAMLKNITGSEERLVDDLGKAQKFALEKIVEEQTKTLTHVNSSSQKAWSLLQEKLTQIISQLSEGQTKLLTNLNDQQQQTLLQISTTGEQTSATLAHQYDSILQQLRQTQSDIWQKLADRQSQAYDSLLNQQKESFTSIADQQQQAYQQASRFQQDSLEQMKAQHSESILSLTSSQTEIMQNLDQRQSQTLQSINEQQMSALQKVNDQQASALNKLMTIQQSSLMDVRRSQDQTLTEMTRRQQEALQQLADSFAGEISGKLAVYMDPISERLQASSDSLIAAQVYAKDVKDVLKLQNESATTLQESIRNLFAQLVETRQSMTEDLVSLKASAGVMSKASDVMSSVYAGSQSGLSEAISQMSNDLMRLSDVLSTVMAGSAEQTRLMQTQSLETYEINQKHLDAVREQISLLSDEMATRIDELMLGFTNLTQDLVKNIDTSIIAQNDTLGGSLRSLTEIMGDEARSMSLFAQEINMDIDKLNENLRSAVGDFNQGMRSELSGILGQFDTEVTDVVRRLARSATELGDAVEALPEAIRHASQPGISNNQSTPVA